jgi:acetyltransferase-like isoleucine patch superfamily enzyme
LVEVVVTREDANTDLALLAEWLVEDGSDVGRGQPVCVVETSKASVEVESPAAGTLVTLHDAGSEIELGRPIALVAESREELAAARESRTRPGRSVSRPASGKATRKAVELAEGHGIDLGSIEKQGFITADDVEALVRAQRGATTDEDDPALSGVATVGVTLPRHADPGETNGTVDADFLTSLRSDPDAVRALPSEEKCDLYRRRGAEIGDDVVLDDGVLVVAPRIVIEAGARIGARATIDCEELFAAGELTHIGEDLAARCRRAVLGSNVHAGRRIRIGGGGHRDPWAVLVVGDSTFIGDEVFINPCRPILIGSEVFLTMRAMLVTHNIGHSVLEGFENRFAPIVLEDMSQIGLGTVVYAGCRVGTRAIVASGSYVVSDVPPGKLAIGVPARVAGDAQRPLTRARQLEVAGRMLDELHELLVLKGQRAIALEVVRGFALETSEGAWHVLLVDRDAGPADLPAGTAGTVVLTLERGDGEVPAGWAVLDLVGRTIEGEDGPVVDSVREFCRKHGIRLRPGPWRYRGGLV